MLSNCNWTSTESTDTVDDGGADFNRKSWSAPQGANVIKTTSVADVTNGRSGGGAFVDALKQLTNLGLWSNCRPGQSTFLMFTDNCVITDVTGANIFFVFVLVVARRR